MFCTIYSIFLLFNYYLIIIFTITYKWCDRVLWYKNPLKRSVKDWVVPLKYDSVMDIVLSDHKPVVAMFDAKVSRWLNRVFSIITYN